MIDVKVSNGSGKPNKLEIGDDGEANVVIHSHPSLTDNTEVFPFREYFTNTASSIDMAVNGATAPLDFYISAQSDYDIFIKYISIVIGDSGTPALNKFGSLTALTNGVRWSWFNQTHGDYELHEGIKTNLEFIRIGGDTAGIGTGTDAFLADVSGGGTEKSYLPNIDISETFGMPYGLRLKKGSKDRLIFTINDNLSGLITFNAVCYGIRM